MHRLKGFRMARLSNRWSKWIARAALAAALAASRARGVPTTAPSDQDTTQPSAQPSATQASPGGPDLTNLSLEDLMNVQVTSVAKEPQKIADAPAAVTVIGQDDIQRSGLATIPDLLRLAPGMDVAQISSNGWAISSRGFNGYLADDLLVLMDGRSVYTPTFGGVLWNSVNYPIQDLDRIEVINGPGSTLWGSNAVNGVVNIISKSAKDTQGLLVDTQGGSQQDIGDVRYGGQLGDNTYYRVYTQYQYTGNGQDANGDPAHDESQGIQGGFRVDSYTTSKDTLTLQGDAYWNQADQLTTPLPFSVDDTFFQNGGNVLGRWTHTESDRADTSLQAYYDRQVLDDTPVGYQQDTLDIQFQNRFPLGAIQDVTWGAGARDYFIRLFPGNSLVNVSPTYTNEFIYNGFIQDQVTIIPDHLQWFVGTKVEYNSLVNLLVEPSTRLLFTPDSHNSFWGAYSRASRVPSIIEDYRETIGPDTLGNDGPTAEETNAFEIGYKTQPFKPLTLSVSGFYNSYTDLIVDVPNLFVPGEVDYANAATAKSYGGELSANWQVTPQWRLGASYSYLQVRAIARLQSPADFFIPAYELQFMDGSAPQNQFQIHSYLDLLKNVQLNASLYYVDSLPFINALAYSGGLQSVSSYFRLDLNVHWQMNKNMALAVGVQNLLSDRHYEYSNINSPQEPTQVPRTFYADWTMTF
jgi:iron complex outermembrane recepter protein